MIRTSQFRFPSPRDFTATILAWAALCLVQDARAADRELHSFERVRLTDVYYSEGVSQGDLDGDGVQDVVYGPYWFKGPDYKTRREIYPAQPQNRQGYADKFFSWVHDFNDDGAPDVFTVGFPGTPAYVYENPGKGELDQLWKKHQVFDWVSNESPQFTNIVGDDRPELVCTRDGYFGYATVDWTKPFTPWTFHKISKQVAPKRFGHGLGVGDVNGDGRIDVLSKSGWYAQPESLADDPRWAFHPVEFARAGGADMHVYDVDGDGDSDVITSLAAHAYGLAWYEQTRAAGDTNSDEIEFKRRLIMGDKPEDNPYGVVFTELHTVGLSDVDGDGLKDIVTGKTYWSHHTQAPMWDAGAVVYWFQLVRTKEGVKWVPHKADADAGVGRQIVTADVNGDGLPDILSGGMKGAHVLIHKTEKVSEARWKAAQPQLHKKLADGLPPDEAAAHMTVPPGFTVELAAGEPQVHQPIAFTIDPRGRLWVAEAYTYPQRAPEGKGRDKIVILEDVDGDGEFESRKIFAEGLNLVSGMEVGHGGVWVGAAPYLMFIPDRDGDDRPDAEPQILLDGFGYQDTHETLNSFNWGPDGWLYGCHGIFTHSNVGKPGAPDDQRTPLNAGVWRYHPTRHKFEVFAHGTSNPWGVDFNDYGDAFITACVIPHLFHVIPGARYERQAGRHFNPHTYDDVKTIADHLHYEGNIRDHAWWGSEPVAPAGTLAAGGGHAHAGAMIYLGDNWPDSYRGSIFMHNIHGNRVNRDLLVPRGSGYLGRHGPDLLLANDKWFRGINLRYGPDGGVYLIDWYDKNACHRNTPEIWDRTNGRIYKVTYTGTEQASLSRSRSTDFQSVRAGTRANKHSETNLAKLDDAELVELHLHKNDWYVRTARRLLHERSGPRVIDVKAESRLGEILNTNDDPTRRLRALWTLDLIQRLDDASLRKLAVEAEHPHIRKWAIRLGVEGIEGNALPGEWRTLLADRAQNDPSRIVRLQLAGSLQRVGVDDRWKIVEQLIQHADDALDHNLPLMYWYAIEPLVPLDADRATGLARTSKIPLISRYIVRRAASENGTLPAAVAMLATAEDDEQRSTILDEMLQAFEGRVNIPMPDEWTPAYDQLTQSKDAGVRDRADKVAVVLGDRRIFPRMRELLTAADAPLEKRKQALDILVRGRDAEAATALQAAIDEPKLRGPAIRALAALKDENTPDVLVRHYASLSADEQRDAINTLSVRAEYAGALLDAIEKKQIPRTDLHAYNVRQMLSLENDRLTERIRDVWGEVRESSADKKRQIAKWKSVLTPAHLKTADVGNGRRLYSKACAACHTLFGDGGKVGPDLTGSNRADLDYILQNVIDPSAVLGKDYRATVIATVDGRVATGLVTKETDSAVTLKTINDTVVIALADIDIRKLSELSMMPEKQLEQLKPEEVRDLVAYLGRSSQVPLRGPRAPIDERSGRVPNAVEGEAMKVVEKTAGNARSQKMGGFTKDRWSGTDQLWWSGANPGDRLTLELPVKETGRYELELVLTRARDYAVVQLSLDGKNLGGPIDLYNAPDVVTTGVLEYPAGELTAGDHKLSVEIIGANPKAAKAFMVGLDYVRLKQIADSR